MIKLSNRLMTIASFIDKDAKVLDIGCDHALLDIYIYQKGISNWIIASDINKNAIMNAINNVKRENLQDYIDIRVGNGLDVLEKDDVIDTIVISGMGSHTIVGILKNNRDKLKNIDTMIIQSNNDYYFLRKEINRLNYSIDREEVVVDRDKYYIIIKFIKKRVRYNREELYFGPVLLKEKKKLFYEFYQRELKKKLIIYNLIPSDKIILRRKIKKEIDLYKKYFNNE